MKGKINIRRSTILLFAALCLYFLVPYIYTCVRTYLIADIPSVDGLGIAGHIEWFDLINETLLAFLTVPLYSLLSAVRENKEELRNRLWLSFGISFLLYALFSIVVGVMTGSMVAGMTGAEDAVSTVYLQLETVGFVVGYIGAFSAVVYTVIGKPIYILAVTILKVVATICGDLFLIPKFGINGVAFSNIAVNAVIAIVSLALILLEHLTPVKPHAGDWLGSWVKIGVFSGSQILLDNIIYIYALIVCKMVESVSAQGDYWTANNFIWGLLLVPTTALAEIIRRGENNGKLKLYLGTAIAIGVVWLITIPGWNPFFAHILGLKNTADIVKIVIMLVPFYLAYNISTVFSSLFVANGKTYYNAIVSVIVNVGYYGIMYVLYLNGFFTPGIPFIVALFGFGMVVNAISSALLWHISANRPAAKAI